MTDGALESASIESWQAALDYFYGLTNWETRAPSTDPEFVLSRIRDLLADLGNPQSAWPAVHVAGTNGKGSTCAIVEAILRTAGYTVGLFTSPHLHSLRERVQVDRAPIDAQSVVTWLNQHRSLLDSHTGLTTFEALTALAFTHFADAAVDMAVVEVGLGGRLDTTNLVEPELCVITPVDLDHTKVLGDTVEAIAADKAGILKPGVPAVVAPQHPGAIEVIGEIARSVGAPVYFATEVATWTRLPAASGGAPGMEVTLRAHPDWGPGRRLHLAAVPPGAYQAPNVVSGVLASAVLAARGRRIADSAISEGVAATRWPGRFEELVAAAGPLAGAPPVLVDGAHNPHGARALSGALTEWRSDQRRVLLAGFTRGKDVGGMVSVLAGVADRAVVTASPHPRAMPVVEAAGALAAEGIQVVLRQPAAEALRAALDWAAPDGVVVATGSIFLAAAVREAWFLAAGLPAPPTDGPRPRRGST